MYFTDYADMSVDDILIELETEYCDPGGDKDGGYTYFSCQPLPSVY